MTGWEKWANFYQRIFYTPAVYISCVVIAIIAGFIFHRKSKLGKLFLLYLSLDLVIYILDVYVRNFSTLSGKEKGLFFDTTNVLICFTELNIYICFFEEISLYQKIRKLFPFFRLIFLVTTFLYGINLIKLFRFIAPAKFADYIAVAEFLILLLPSFTYYIKLFSENPKEILLDRPSFWITTGILLFSILSIPFYLIGYYLFSYKYKYYTEISAVLFYVPLAINYILLSKAFLCRKPLTV
jgi:hypothetical protein